MHCITLLLLTCAFSVNMNLGYLFVLDTNGGFQRIPSSHKFKAAAAVAAFTSYQFRVPGIEVQYGVHHSNPYGTISQCDCSSASSSSDDAEI